MIPAFGFGFFFIVIVSDEGFIDSSVWINVFFIFVLITTISSVLCIFVCFSLTFVYIFSFLCVV